MVLSIASSIIDEMDGSHCKGCEKTGMYDIANFMRDGDNRDLDSYRRAAKIEQVYGHTGNIIICISTAYRAPTGNNRYNGPFFLATFTIFARFLHSCMLFPVRLYFLLVREHNWTLLKMWTLITRMHILERSNLQCKH